MKKVLLAALAAFTLTASTAHASRFVVDALPWMNGLVAVNTTLAVSSTFDDTTATFGITGWAIPFNGTADTVVFGALLVEADSSAAFTPNLTVLTYKILASRDGLNWTEVFKPGTMTLTSGVKRISIPLFFSANRASAAAIPQVHPLASAKIRIVVSGVTGTLAATKCSLIHFVE